MRQAAGLWGLGCQKGGGTLKTFQWEGVSRIRSVFEKEHSNSTLSELAFAMHSGAIHLYTVSVKCQSVSRSAVSDSVRPCGR